MADPAGEPDQQRNAGAHVSCTVANCPTCETVQPDGPVLDAAFDMASADVLTAWRVRNAALAVAASFVHPGPDWEDEQARKRLVAEWVSEGHDQVEGENHQRLVAVQRMIAAEALVRDLGAHLTALCDHPDNYADRYNVRDGRPCAGCYDARDAFTAWATEREIPESGIRTAAQQSGSSGVGPTMDGPTPPG